VLGLIFGLVAALGFGLVVELADQQDSSSTSPVISWRADRSYALVVGLASGLTFGLTFGLGAGLATVSGFVAGFRAGFRDAACGVSEVGLVRELRRCARDPQ
jgi:hypothetical protein